MFLLAMELRAATRRRPAPPGRTIACALLGDASRLVDRPHGEPETRRREYRGEAAQLRIARFREDAVGRLSRELRTARDRRDATMGERDVPERKRQRGLMALLDHSLQIGCGLGGIRQALDQPIQLIVHMRIWSEASAPCQADREDRLDTR